DCTSAVNYLMFAATARDLGTCWIGHGQAIKNQALKKEIGSPEGYQVAAAVIIGYPTSIPKPPKRNEPIIIKSIMSDNE
ncbi:unnamed protein product, partial [marine sediment metagenome]